MEGFEKAVEKQRKSVEKAGSGKKKAKAVGGKNK